MTQFIVLHHSIDNSEVVINVGKIYSFFNRDDKSTNVYVGEDLIIVREGLKEIKDKIYACVGTGIVV